MASNFDFLKERDTELFNIIEDAEKLFRDEYFNQCVVQLRIFAEKTAKKVLGGASSDLTFDDVINCLKDKIKSDQEKEFVDDLYFIKKEGNKCAHGEDTTAISTLEAIKRAFEIAITYAYFKKKNEKLLKLQFDETLLITTKPRSENKLVDKYVKEAEKAQEELLKEKQAELESKVEPDSGIKDKNHINNPKSYEKKSKKKELSPTKKRIKEKVKAAKKNLKQNINSSPKKTTKKEAKIKKQKKDKIMRYILFFIFCIISLIFVTKMLFFF